MIDTASPHLTMILKRPEHFLFPAVANARLLIMFRTLGMPKLTPGGITSFSEGQISNRGTELACRPSQELVHHAGGSADFQRLATRLARERLACAWPVLAAKQPRPADNTLSVPF